MAKGSMHSTGKVTFRPDDAKFLKLKTANVDVDACLCMDCGSVRLMADTEKVKELTDKE
jgi:hypothetical protein